MSIENNLASIAESLKTIAAKLGSAPVTTTSAAPVAPAAPAAPVLPAAAPAAPAAVMPPFVMPAAPAVTPVVTTPLPFADAKGLMEYVMGKYKKLGPVKGALIQNVLSELSLHNINDVKPEQYATFYAKVEAIQ